MFARVDQGLGELLGKAVQDYVASNPLAEGELTVAWVDGTQAART